MYLTRFTVNTARRSAGRLLSSPQAMHAAVMASFPEPPAVTADARVLWRVDQSNDRRTLLYIVSPAEPDLTHLVEQAGWPTTETWQTRPYGGFLDALTGGQQWAFRLTANPVRDGRRAGADRTRRFGHVTVEQQGEWLAARAPGAGFRLTEAETGQPDLQVHRRDTLMFRRDKSTVTLRVATYDGRLEVTEPERLRHTLTRGLGHAKAYGCGLLTLAPLDRP